MNLETIISLIQIRKFLKGALEDLSISMSKEETNKCIMKIDNLNKKILEFSLDLDIDNLTEEKVIWSRTSTEDPMQVLSKFMQNASTQDPLNDIKELVQSLNETHSSEDENK